MEDNLLLRKNKNMVTRVIDDAAILLPVLRTSNEINCIYSLNKAASRFWEMVDGKKTLGQIKKQLAKEYASSEEEIAQELRGLLKDLQEIKAVR